MAICSTKNEKKYQANESKKIKITFATNKKHTITIIWNEMNSAARINLNKFNLTLGTLQYLA